MCLGVCFEFIPPQDLCWMNIWRRHAVVEGQVMESYRCDREWC